MENENYTCLNCIWHDQCESDEPCGFFDRGQSALELSDGEIEIDIEVGRKEYGQAYQKYIQEFCDGNKE